MNSPNFQLATASEFRQSACQNRILGSSSIFLYSEKHIIFTVTCPLSSIQGYIDILNANASTIMAMMNFDAISNGYSYNFDTFPVFNIANGVFGTGSFLPPIESFIHSTPYGFGISPADAKAKADAATKTIQLIWIYDPLYPSGTAWTMQNNFHYRSNATGGATPDNIYTPMISVAPPADTHTPSSGSVFQLTVPIESDYTWFTPGGDWFTILGQDNSIFSIP